MKKHVPANDLLEYNCPKVMTPPVIDGTLDDEAWKIAPTANLVLSEAGKIPVKTTTVRMCWDDDNLYIAFDCADEDVWATLTKHDDPLYTEEVVEAFLSPDRDLTRHFEFVINPLNVTFDAEIHQEIGASDISVNAGWECAGLRTAVQVDGTVDDRTDIDRGWTVEVAIPFASLGRPTPEPGEEWLGNLYRIDLSPEPVEFQSWCPTLISPPSFHVPDRFGKIIFLSGSPNEGQ